MHIAIVGAGIVGTATAYELACDGHAVTVFEQRGAAAEEASFANAGLLSPAPLIPWAAPGIGGPARQRLWGRHAAIRLAQGAGLSELRWLWRHRRAAKGPMAESAVAALARFGLYSHARMRQVAQSLELDPESSQGVLVLLRSPADLERVQPAVRFLRDAGVRVLDVDAATARLIEPGLAVDNELAGALHVPEGESGNCRLFAQMLRYAAQARGAQFVFQARVASLRSAPAGVLLDGEPEARRFDAVVVCAGLAAAGLVRPMGTPAPMAALHGYTISAPLREDTHAPQGTVIDPVHRLTIARQGQRVRVGGGAELGTGDGTQHAATLQTLYNAASGWFPGGAQWSSSQVQTWRGARPMLPDGLPLVGASGAPGVWINAGHGACGWALACGSARVVADLIAQRAPEVDVQSFGVRRF
ncbi:FAD-dependent oxidoreductase [Paracidovorax konjaci]|uniref:D-amino-acid dehydrogenase n=1 Tax=Paracidovorax konjaci TaxID=32040 RepID=A0A1I1WKV7_9BURK|nr:FAD-dependent oxidoreductase [Paracidovorax konjaci]SFD95776.1 D-amino-acid dehydrogenase [Paracidovorax konjaci]